MKAHKWKYHLFCADCGEDVGQFSSWFADNQQCPSCGHNIAEVEYSDGYDELGTVIEETINPDSLWNYHQFLPLEDQAHVISFGEGAAPIDRWEFLEEFAQEHLDIECEIYAHRNDLNPATGTFKDLAGTVVASVMNENDREAYVVASTGNTAVAYSKYLSAAGIDVYAFIPEYSSKLQVAEVGIFGQKLFRVQGDYEDAKDMAKKFAREHDFLLAAGNFDPMRIEAKKTMVYEWLRQLGKLPTVYCQALSGGTGPLGIAKACHELHQAGISAELPRQLLVQTNKCSPMADAWADAKAAGFPDGWEYDYPVYKNPESLIATLTTGDPKTYPKISRLVRESDGEIIAYDETRAVDVARLVAYETAVVMGPAAAIPVGGFIQSLQNGFIENGDLVMLNIGEGMRRAPEFMEETIYTSRDVSTSADTELFHRKDLRNQLWQAIYE